jgi:hypothetical protein
MIGRRSLGGKASTSFLKKRSKKLLLNWVGGGETGADRITKSFLVLFFKKERLAYFGGCFG